MYELTIEASFAAAHNLRGYQGECEKLHGHNWRVEAVVAASELDHLGMVMDFRDLKAALGSVLQGFDHTYLNDVEPFTELNPTTEDLCRVIAGRLAERLPRSISIRRVSCWESEKCGASYLPEDGAGGGGGAGEREGGAGP
jgi:6-pyruvoyltetrahydropterin/6-carboxytetrahydropterin synthase